MVTKERSQEHLNSWEKEDVNTIIMLIEKTNINVPNTKSVAEKLVISAKNADEKEVITELKNIPDPELKVQIAWHVYTVAMKNKNFKAAEAIQDYSVEVNKTERDGAGITILMRIPISFEESSLIKEAAAEYMEYKRSQKLDMLRN